MENAEDSFFVNSERGRFKLFREYLTCLLPEAKRASLRGSRDPEGSRGLGAGEAKRNLVEGNVPTEVGSVPCDRLYSW